MRAVLGAAAVDRARNGLGTRQAARHAACRCLRALRRTARRAQGRGLAIRTAARSRSARGRPRRRRGLGVGHPVRDDAGSGRGGGDGNHRRHSERYAALGCATCSGEGERLRSNGRPAHGEVGDSGQAHPRQLHRRGRHRRSRYGRVPRRHELARHGRRDGELLVGAADDLGLDRAGKRGGERGRNDRISLRLPGGEQRGDHADVVGDPRPRGHDAAGKQPLADRDPHAAGRHRHPDPSAGPNDDDGRGDGIEHRLRDRGRPVLQPVDDPDRARHVVHP